MGNNYIPLITLPSTIHLLQFTFLDLFVKTLNASPAAVNRERPCWLGESVGSHFWLEMADSLMNASPCPETAPLFSDTGKGKREEHILLFVLDDCSCANRKLSFDDLKGKDRLLAQLLQSFTYLDVHLAVVTQHTAGSTSANDGEGGRGNVFVCVFDMSVFVPRYMNTTDYVYF